MILMFLAGMGLPQFAQTVNKLQPKPPGMPTHKAGVRTEAAANPAMSISPMLAQMLAMRMQGGGGTPVG